MKTIDASATSADPRGVVWQRLADVSQWPVWGPWSSVAIEGGADHGPGAVRVLVKRPLRLRERVTGWEPEVSMSYELLEGMNVDGYRAEVRLTDLPDGGTEVRWHSEYERAGLIAGRILKAAVPDVCRRVAAG
jgi:Polyketide cyclase / dehydrase and lipid transport